MERRRAFVKMTGDLLVLRPDVIAWLRERAETAHLVICTGGGTQITQALNARGIPWTFGPLDREIPSDEGKLVALEVLEENRAQLQARLRQEGIAAEIDIPFRWIGGAPCHINGDLHVLNAYQGFDELYVLTLRSRLEKKIGDFAKSPKVVVVGFDDHKEAHV